MKKIFSLLLAVLMLVSMIPTAMAADYTEGTTIKVVGTGADTYTVTVPAKLAPGESGTVTANGTWPSSQTLNVTAPSSVTLTHGTQTMDVGITFDGISQVGSDTGTVSAEETVSVAAASALFGTWTGHLDYTVEMVKDSTGGTTEPDTGDDEVVASEGSATFSDGVTLSWDELKLEENGTKYGYDASKIGLTSIYAAGFKDCTSLTSINFPNSINKIGLNAFDNCTSIISIHLPDSVTTIETSAFGRCTNLATINFAGTMEQWNAITVNTSWNNVPATEVICSDGTVALS